MKLILGNVEFDDNEAPAQLKGLGGDQQLAVTKFIGSGKVVQALGPQPNPVSWTGTFINENAIRRARQIDYYRAQGDAIELSWGDYLADVVIKSFIYDPENEFNVPYSITLEVVTDRTLPVEPERLKQKESLIIEKLKVSDEAVDNLKASSEFTSKTVTLT